MGLKFQRDDSLDRMLEDLVILPEQKDKIKENEERHAKDIERFLNPKPKAKKAEETK